MKTILIITLFIIGWFIVIPILVFVIFTNQFSLEKLKKYYQLFIQLIKN